MSLPIYTRCSVERYVKPLDSNSFSWRRKQVLMYASGSFMDGDLGDRLGCSLNDIDDERDPSA